MKPIPAWIKTLALIIGMLLGYLLSDSRPVDYEQEAIERTWDWMV